MRKQVLLPIFLASTFISVSSAFNEHDTYNNHNDSSVNQTYQNQTYQNTAQESNMPQYIEQQNTQEVQQTQTQQLNNEQTQQPLQTQVQETQVQQQPINPQPQQQPIQPIKESPIIIDNSEKNGFFLGLGIASHRTRSETHNDTSTEAQNKRVYWGSGYQVLVGYKHLSKPSAKGISQGWRIYVNYDGNIIELDGEQISGYHIISLNWEALINIKRFGAFVGWGLGALQYDKQLYSTDKGLGDWGVYWSLNYGLRMSISKRNSLEFYHNLPITQFMSIPIGKSNYYIPQTYNWGVRYIFTF